MKNENRHAAFLVLAGSYILYIAWQLLDNLLSGAEDIPRAALIAAIVVFAASGIGVLIFAWKIWRKSRKRDTDQEELD